MAKPRPTLPRRAKITRASKCCDDRLNSPDLDLVQISSDVEHPPDSRRIDGVIVREDTDVVIAWQWNLRDEFRGWCHWRQVQLGRLTPVEFEAVMNTTTALAAWLETVTNPCSRHRYEFASPSADVAGMSVASQMHRSLRMREVALGWPIETGFRRVCLVSNRRHVQRLAQVQGCAVVSPPGRSRSGRSSRAKSLTVQVEIGVSTQAAYGNVRERR